MRSALAVFMIWAGLSAALFFGVLPSLLDAAAGIRQETAIGTYAEETGQMTADEIALMREDAVNYNHTVMQEQQLASFSYQGNDAGSEEYQSLLRCEEEGMMAVIEIPSIGQRIPVFHGTDPDVLEYACGHVYGTSLPVGGSGTHSVIAGHTGLPGAELFSDLKNMKMGDRFYLRVLGETHAYETDQIKVVLPEEESAYLQTVPGKDYVTLYTCTPYGINDHRLLVRGSRILPDPEEEDVFGRITLDQFSQNATVRLALCAACPVLVLITGCIRARKQRRLEVVSRRFH